MYSRINCFLKILRALDCSETPSNLHKKSVRKGHHHQITDHRRNYTFSGPECRGGHAV